MVDKVDESPEADQRGGDPDRLDLPCQKCGSLLYCFKYCGETCPVTKKCVFVWWTNGLQVTEWQLTRDKCLMYCKGRQADLKIPTGYYRCGWNGSSIWP